ncbi:MAG: choice-of-anchor D domain-containing protein [bacterium]
MKNVMPGWRLRFRLISAVVLNGLFAAWPVVTQAAPVTAGQAAATVSAWLAADSNPMNAGLSHAIGETMAYPGLNGTNAFYVVSLKPTGYVVVAADDVAGSVIAFSATGGFDASSRSVLYAMLRADLAQRVVNAKAVQAQTTPSKTLPPAQASAVSGKSGAGPVLAGTVVHPSPFETIARVRVPPLLPSHWGETTARGEPCYNYYTPSNCPAGSAAIALSQIIHLYRQELPGGIGLYFLPGYVNEEPAILRTRGGNESGGPYNWDSMVDDPANAASLSLANRQAIGALCSDVGVTLTDASYDYMWNATLDRLPGDLASRLTLYYGFREGGHVGLYTGEDPILSGNEVDAPATTPDLNMINANLDAGFPVMLRFFYDNTEAVRYVSPPIDCDGYGYSWDPNTTGANWMFHHLNVGNNGNGDIWYTLPEYPNGGFTNILTVNYNIMATTNGEIVSGRVTDETFLGLGETGFSMPGVTMVISNQSTHVCRTTVTGSRGIYSFVVEPNANYTVFVQPPVGSPSLPLSKDIWVDESVDGLSCGNVWGVNFLVPSYLIAGQVTNAATGAAMASMPVLFVNADQAFTNILTTDEGGFFAAPMPANWSGTVTPLMNGGGSFAPPSFFTNSLVNNNTNVNFAWLAPTMVAISGTVFRSDQPSLNVAGVLISLSNETITVSSNVTYAKGEYVVSNAVTFSNGILFSITTLTFSNTVLLASPPVSYDAYGNLTSDNGVTFSAADITFASVLTATNFSSAGTAVSDASGNYVAWVPIHWYGTATPTYATAPNGTFYPAGRTYTNLTQDTGFQYYYWLPPANITISGTIRRRDNGATVPNVTFATSAGQSCTTDSSGDYQLKVPYLFNGTISPSISRAGVFLPEVRTYSLVQSDIYGENYFWTPASPQVSGRVVDSSGNGVSGMVVTLSDIAASATTDVHGAYALVLPNMGWSGWLIPSGPPGDYGHQFIASSNYLSLVITDMVVAVFTDVPPCVISGTIALNGTTIRPTVTLTLDGVVGATHAHYGVTVTTAGDGSYRAPVPNGWTGVVTSLTTDFAGSFSPSGYDYLTPVTVSVPDQNYTWTPVPLSISGTVRDVSSNPKTNVTLSRCLPDGTVVEQTISGTNGGYTFTNLAFGWSGVVSARALNGALYSRGNITNSYAYSAITSNQVAQDFTWIQSMVTVAGTFLRDDGVAVPVAGASIRFVGGVSGVPYASASPVAADADGNYTALVPVGWTGVTVVSHADAGGVFRPSSRSYASPVSSSTNFQNYYWMPPLNLTVSGTVRYRDNGENAPGVTVSANGVEIVTGAGGQYSIPVPYLWSGSISVSSPRGGVFLPTSYAVPTVHASVSNQDFLWTPPSPQVSGRILNADNGVGVAGVVLTFLDSYSGLSYARTTDVTGAYAMILPYKIWTGSISPAYIPGGVFNPATMLLSNVVFDTVLTNWLWTPPKTVSGCVVRNDSYRPVEGVTIRFVSDNAVFTNSTTTAVDGTYTLTLPRAMGGTNRPAYLPGSVFSPTQRVYLASVTNNLVNQDYLWWPSGITISGTVTDNNGSPLPGAVLTLANATNAAPSISNAPLTVTSGALGTYSFTVPPGWSGSVTPAYSNGNFFLPPIIRFAAVTNDQTAQNFQWFPPSYVAISGFVLRADNSILPAPGAAVLFYGTVGPVPSFSVAYADVAGFYIVYVPRGWSGSSFLSHPDGGTFYPSSKTYTAIGAAAGPDFYFWLPPPNLSVSGRVIFRDTGLPAAGVTLTTSDSRSTLTDTNGVYAFTNVPYLWSATLTPSHLRGGAFQPGSFSIPPVHGSVTGINFDWLTSVPQLSGRVLNGNTGLGVSGVTVSLSDGSATATTDTNGSYRLILPWRGWSGLVTPFIAGGTFTPVSTSVTNVIFDATVSDFVWLPATVLAGHVTRTDTLGPVAGATLTLSGGLGSVLTDTNGAYTLLVPRHWTGNVTPSHAAGGSFSPISSPAYSDVGAGPYVQDYQWTPPLMTLSGRVTRAVSGAAVAGVSLTFTNSATSSPYAPLLVPGGGTRTVLSDTNGYYGLPVPFGWSGTVMPYIARGGVFNPLAYTYSALSTSLTNADFVWLPPGPQISGRVLRFDSLAGVADVVMIFSNDASLLMPNPLTVVVTDSNGNYQVTVPNNWLGTITPVITQYTGAVFAPSQRAFTNVQDDVSDTNRTQFILRPPAALLVTLPSPVSRGSIAGATSGWYTVGAMLSITASPNSVSKFTKWLEDGSTNAARTVVLRPGTNTYTATFVDLGPAFTFIGLDPSVGLDFGNVIVGKLATRSFVIKNTGTSPSTIMGTAPPSTFTALPNTYTLNPGATQLVTMTFAPVAALTFTGTVAWATYPAPSSGSPKFFVQGTGQVLSDVLLYTNGVDFGTMLVGQTATRTVRLFNRSSVPLTLSGKWSNGTDFSLSGLPVTIPAGKSNVVTISFAPKTIKDYGGALLVITASGVYSTISMVPVSRVVANVGGTWTSTMSARNYTLYLRQTNSIVDGIMICTQNKAMTNQYVAGISIGSLSGALYRASASVGSLALTAAASSLAGKITCAGIATNLSTTWTRTSTTVPSSIRFLARPAIVSKPAAAVTRTAVSPAGVVAVAAPLATDVLPVDALRLTLLDLLPAELLQDDAELVVVVMQNGRPVAISPALDRYHLSWLLQTRIETEGADENANGVPDLLEAALGMPLQDGRELLIVRKHNGCAVPEAPFTGTAVDGAAVPLSTLPATWTLKPAKH